VKLKIIILMDLGFVCKACKYKFDKPDLAPLSRLGKCPKCGSKRIKYTTKGRAGRIAGELLALGLDF